MNLSYLLTYGALSLRAKVTIVLTLYMALALAILSGMVVHLQKENFRIRAKDDAATAIGELSNTLFHKWDAAKSVKENLDSLSSYKVLKTLTFKNESIVYVVFQDPAREIRYIAKSMPAFVWMMYLTKFDPYTERTLSITGSATRRFASYPEGAVTEYLGAVYGKNKSPLGTVRVGISDKMVRESMGQLTKITLLKILTVNLLILVVLAALIFYIASAVEHRLKTIHIHARKMLDSTSYKADTSNVLVQLTHEFSEIENMVSSLKQKFMELASTISHEFRSPMQAIEGYVDFLRKGGAGPVNPDMDRYLKIIGENAERFQGFIDNVMDLVRLGGGNFPFALINFKAGDVIARGIELFAKQATESGITLKATINAPDLSAYGDPNRIYQVLVNLISNALKFTPSGGTIEIGAEQQDNFIRFYVKDNGPGIPLKQQSKLFSEFFQVPDMEPLRGFKGLGIGLALCKKLVEAQGGAISLESEQEKGTTVSFTMPKNGYYLK